MAGELAMAGAVNPQRRTTQFIDPSFIGDNIRANKAAKEAAAAKEQADRDRRFEQITKNSVFTKQYKNDYFNRQSQQINKNAMDKIVESYLNGGNMFVVGMEEVKKAQEAHAQLNSADIIMDGARKAHDKAPQNYAWYSLSGDNHENVFQALDDPSMDGKADELNNVFGSPGFNVITKNIGGIDISVPQFNGALASTSNGMETAKKLTDPNQATVNAFEDFNFQDNKMRVLYQTLPQQNAVEIAAKVLADPRVVNDAVYEEYQKQAALARQKNQFLSWQEFSKNANVEAIAASKADEITKQLMQGRYNERQMNWSPNAPRETKATPTQKNYNGWSPEPTYDRNTEETLMSLGQGGANPRVTDFLVPVGTKSLDATGKLIKSDLAGSPIAQKTIAKGVATLWNDSEKGKRKKELYMKYLIDSGAGYVAQYVPATNANFREFAQITQSTETEEDMQALLEATGRVVGTGGKEIMDGFTKELYGVGVNAKFPSGKPAAKPAATTTKMNAQGKVTPASKTPSFQ